MFNRARKDDPWMQTYSGGVFYILEPRAEDVHLVDIAHALSMLCRYSGHTDYFYSVGEHSIYMSHRVSPEAAPYALVHDASEAYVQDLISPIKRNVTGYKEIEDRVAAVIVTALGLPTPSEEILEEVHIADVRMLQTERRDLLKEPMIPYAAREYEPFKETVHAWPPAIVKREFLARAAELGVEYR